MFLRQLCSWLFEKRDSPKEGTSLKIRNGFVMHSVRMVSIPGVNGKRLHYAGCSCGWKADEPKDKISPAIRLFCKHRDAQQSKEAA